MGVVVEIQNVTHVFPPNTIALEDIQAELPSGQIIGLVGPDGAGKTTLIRLIAGLLIPTKGKITVEGLDTVQKEDQIHAQMGYMPQRFGLYEDLSVLENLQLYADLKGILETEKPALFEKLLTFTALSPFTKRLAKDLSGGMKQKLGLACALIKKPKLLLLDEPSVGVDPISRRELWSMVNELLDNEICIVWSTAYLDEAEKCHQVLLLNEGKLRFFGKPQELIEKVQGRVFRIQHPENKRAALREMSAKPEVMDAVIEGEDLRLVLKETSADPSLKLTSPKLEDAFIDLLGKSNESMFQIQQTFHNAVEVPIIAHHLTKKYGDFVAAQDVTFEVKRGKIFGLLGPNGAGKSTTFKMLCGLISPTNGEAMINGVNFKKAQTQAREHIGYMAQKFSLYGNLTVGQNLDFFAGAYGVRDDSVIEKTIGAFSLGPYLHSFCDALPIGFKQRLSFATATLHSPAVLFLDEPTSGMDPLTRRAFWRQISEMAENGCTIMVTTHFMDEAENCDTIALLYGGKIIYQGSTDALKEKVKTEENPNPTLEDAFIQCIESYDHNKT